MSSSSEISHKGRVVSVTPEVTTVEIVSESACGACHAKGLCSLGDSKVKMVEVPTSGWSDIRPGDEVEVVLKASMGHKAVLLAYMIPLVLLVAVLLAAVSAGVGELYAGLAAIAAVAVYYFGLWLMRGRLRNEYIFNIKK
mgnify:CR=1 FL=1